MMRKLKVGLGLVFALMMGLVWISCGSSPTTPSESSALGNRLSGRFTNLGSAESAFQGFAQSTLEGITVYVREDPAIQTRVSSDGSFTLRGLPNGQFTLVFGDSLGDLLFDSVLPNTELTIVVQLTSRGRVRLVDEKRTGIGHGDLEIEGLAQEVSPGSHPNEGTLVVHNYDIEARPGATTIREGNRAREMADIRRGNRVHVKGVWEGGKILAHEIKLQGPGDDDNGTSNGTECPDLNGGKVGEKIVLEGTVLSGDSSSFFMRAEGRVESIQIDFGKTPTCVGQAGKSGECKVEEGDKVNVKGTLESCTKVLANEVKIQKKG